RARAELRAQGETLLGSMSTVDDAPSASEGARGSAKESRFWLLDGVAQFWIEAAQRAPIILVFDDLQWADAASGRLLRFLAPELARVPLLVIETLRDASRGEGDRSLSWLSRAAERIELARLTQAEVGRYIAGLIALPAAPEALSGAVHRATAGNPLFV